MPPRTIATAGPQRGAPQSMQASPLLNLWLPRVTQVPIHRMIDAS
jgi:hypothetical protein